MEEETESTRYWCHECSRIVAPITTESDSIKCSLCNGGFVEEVDSIRSDHHHQSDPAGSDPDRSLSLWAPILLGLMGTPRRQRRPRQLGFDDDNEEEDRRDSADDRRRQDGSGGGESDADAEFEALRRRRNSTAILHLLQGIRAGMVSEPENNLEGDNNNNNNRENERDRDHDRERVILINPFSQTIIVHGGVGGNPFDPSNASQNPFGSFGDYFVGPGLEQLLQHLAENDPNRYGTPPAQKEAIEAMPTVPINENSIQCSVCLEEFEMGAEAREMPCKHRFHGDCILPWLELHSSCPVCRYQLPADESKINREQEMANGGSGNLLGVSGESGSARNSEERRVAVSLPWLFSSLFSVGSNSMNITSSSVNISSPSGDSESSPRAQEPERNDD